MPLEVIRSGFFRSAGQRVLREANYEAGDAHLRAHVKEFGDDAANQVFVMPNTLVALWRGLWCRQYLAARFAHFRQMSKVDQRCDEQKDSCDHQIRAPDSVRFRS